MMKLICCMIQMPCFLYLILKSLCYMTYQSISSVKFPRAEHFIGRSNPPNIQQKYSTKPPPPPPTHTHTHTRESKANFKLILRRIFKRKFLIFFDVTGYHFFNNDRNMDILALLVFQSKCTISFTKFKVKLSTNIFHLKLY